MGKNQFWENNELKDEKIIRTLRNAARWYEDGCLWEVAEACAEIARAIKLFDKHDFEINTKGGK